MAAGAPRATARSERKVVAGTYGRRELQGRLTATGFVVQARC